MVRDGGRELACSCRGCRPSSNRSARPARHGRRRPDPPRVVYSLLSRHGSSGRGSAPRRGVGDPRRPCALRPERSTSTASNWICAPGLRCGGSQRSIVLVLSLAVIGGQVSAVAFAPRYTAVVFPLLILCRHGHHPNADQGDSPRVLGAVAALGLAASLHAATVSRTQLGDVGRALGKGARPGDLVRVLPGPACALGAALRPEGTRTASRIRRPRHRSASTGSPTPTG